MKMYNLSKVALPLAVALLLGMTGCSSDSSSTPVVATDTTETYTGDKSLSGSFETFNTTSNSIARAASRAPGDADTEIVKLYVLDENGDLKDTGLTCDITEGTSEYVCNDIAGEKEYIVRYVKDLGNGQVLELKSNVAVGTENVTGAEVNRVTSLIVEAISKAVEEAIVGVGIDESAVAELIASVKEAIKTSISSLVQQGLISIPTMEDMTVTASFDDFIGTAEDNDNLAESSGVILTDDSVTNVLGSGKNDAQLLAYADMTTDQLVAEIFAQTFGEGDGAPDWVFNFLSDKYNNVPSTYTVGGFLSMIEFESEGHDYDDQDNLVWDPDTWFTENLERAGVPAADQQSVMNGIISDLNAIMADTTTANGAFSLLKAEIQAHYALKAKTTKTDDDYKKLADFPAVIEFLFPKTFVDSLTAATPLQNMGQGIVLIAFVEEVLANDVVSETLSSYDIFEDQIRNMHIVEIDPFFLFEDLGFEVGGVYDTLSIGHFEARTDKFWNGNTETEFLSVYASVEKPGWFMGETEVAVDPDLMSGTLTYPTATGTETVTLSVEGDGDWVQLKYSPWSMCDQSGCPEPDATKMDITDHVSGDYVLTATYDGETVTKTFKQFVLKGAFNFRAKLLTPTEMPQWPEELQGDNIDWANLTTEQQALQDAFNTEQQAYEPTRFAVTNTTDNTVEDVVFKWDDGELQEKIAELNLPDNIVPAYQVGINLRDLDCEQSGTNNWEECNTEIYNTWWNNRPIKSTSFMLPIPLKANEANEKYSIGVNVVFIDKDTGRDVGQGGHSWAEFEVGTATQLNGDEQIVINGSVGAEEGATIPTALKVGMMSETCTFDEVTFFHTCTRTAIGTPVSAADGDYSLSVNVADVQSALGANKHIMVMAFDDLDGDGVFDDWDPAGTPEDNEDAESGYWPEGTHLWFENWGDFKVGTSTYNETTGDHTYTNQKVVPNEDVTVEGIDFTVWNWNFAPEQSEAQ